jgi:hypothetical protein
MNIISKEDVVLVQGEWETLKVKSGTYVCM